MKTTLSPSLRKLRATTITLFLTVVAWTAIGAQYVVQPGPADSKDIWTTSVYSFAGGAGIPGGGLNDKKLHLGGWGDLYYALIQFDLSQVPGNATSAVLYLYCFYNNDGSGTPMYLDRITQAWDWRTSGTGPDRERLWWADRPAATQWIPNTLPAPLLGQWYAVDITGLYNAWQSGLYPNYGLQLRPQLNWNNFNSFYSADYTDNPALRPKLVVEALAGRPVVQTLPPTSVTTASARLNGYVNPNGSNTTAQFEFGTTLSYGSNTPSANVGTNSQDIGFTLTGLTPGTIYHYRIVAWNGAGTSQGSEVAFSTLPISTTATQAWVAGTGDLGLRLRSAPSLSASVLLVMPEGAVVTLLGGTQSADGFLWRQVRYGGQEGWAAAQYLVFAATGTPPLPPVAPNGLAQRQADGSGPIPGGGTVPSASVVLAATPGGASGEQFKMQFEVRPSTSSFSGPTHTSGFVRGGSEARVTVSGLSNQSYHWRARVLDGNGVASGWVSFSANSTDFVVNAPKLPSALFWWSPAQIFTSDSVQFTAEAAGGTGLTFAWDFGGGGTASGATVTRTFTQVGEVAVTLTVTDSQSNQSQHTETINVVSKLLVDQINRLAKLTTNSLDQLLAQAHQVAGAADYFQQGVESAEGKIVLSTVFDAIGLGISAPDFKGLIRTTLSDPAVDAVVEVHSELVQWASGWLFDRTFRNGQNYSGIFIPNLTTFITQKKAVIEQLRQEAVAAAGTLTPAQAEQLARNLQTRSSGNVALENGYASKSLLPVTFADLKATDEDSWSFMVGDHLLGVSVGLGLIAVGDGFDGFAAVMLTVSSAAGFGTLDKLNILSGQSTDAQMLALSVDVLAQGTFYAIKIASNAENGFVAVRDALTPVTPAGQMTVEHITQGALEQFAFARRWFAKSAYAKITIENTGPAAATYRVEAVYRKTFKTTGLLPFPTYGIGERNYDINVMSFADGIQLNPGAQRVVTLNYLSPDGGQIPNGPIYYTLSARTADGWYLTDGEAGQFGTTFIDQDGNVIDHSQLQDVLLAAMPVRPTLLLFSGSSLCDLSISVRNPFETPLLFNLQQPLPAGTVVIETAGAILITNQLVWDVDLQPGESRLLKVTLQLSPPLAQPPLTNTTVSAYDSLNGTWLQFQQTPTVVQVTETPPPQLQSFGFTAGEFHMGLWTFIPGVYRVEATTNFTVWTPVVTTTNTAGIFQINDEAAPSYPARFYRAGRISQ